MASYAIVYATASKAIRRVIADDDGEFSVEDAVVVCSHPNGSNTNFPLMRGESAHVVSTSDPHMPHHWKDAIRAHTGTYPPDITCALIDNAGVVQHVVRADPDVDSAPDGLIMVACDRKVIVGDIYDSETRQFHRARKEG